MRIPSYLLVLTLAAAIPAQSFYVPNNNAGGGAASNAYPFNTTDMRYQALITATDLGSAPAVIRGFALAATTSAELTYAQVTMKMAHVSTPTLSTTFDQNLLAGSVTTMQVSNWSWFVTANTWNEVDLQVPFIYNGIDNVVVEFTVLGRGTGSNMWRDGTNQRVYQGSYTGQPTGSSSMSAFKMRLLTGDAGMGAYGRGCLGTGLSLPSHRLTGSSQLGQVVNCTISNAAPNAVAVLEVGFWLGNPFPLDLVSFGLPGCFLYFPPSFESATVTDAAGNGSISIAVPNAVSLIGYTAWSQYGVFDSQGISVSNYCRALVGN